MGDVVNLQAYKISKEEEKKKVRMRYGLTKKLDNAYNVLKTVEGDNDISLLVKSYDLGSGGVQAREVLIDEEVICLIEEALKLHIKGLREMLEEIGI